MIKAELEAQLALLETLVPICDVRGMDVLEKYAAGMAEVCKQAVYDEISPDPAVYMASCSYSRGQGDVWLGLSKMRETVSRKIADVRQQLDAIRKEE